MKKLVLFTDGFPYGKNEKPFILPELERLVEEYDITIASCAGAKIKEDVQHITQLDSRIHTVFFDYKNTFWERFFYAGRALLSIVWWQEAVEIVRTRKKVAVRLMQAFCYYVSADRYRRLILREHLFDKEPAIAYTFWNKSYTLSLVWLKKSYPSLKVISRIHRHDLYNEAVKGSGRQAYKKYMDPRTDAIFFISEEGYQYYLKNFAQGKKLPDHYILRLGVNRKESRNPQNTSDVFELVSCSSVIPLKRVDRIAEGIALLPDGYKIRWVHFGDGTAMEQVKERVRELLADRRDICYEFRGFCPNETVMEYYGHTPIDCFITTTSSEGLPVSIMEALSFGIPVIAPDVNGIAEEVENDSNGILLSEKAEAGEVADAIMKLLEASEKQKEVFRENAYQMWEQKFDKEKNVKKFMETLAKYAD